MSDKDTAELIELARDAAQGVVSEQFERLREQMLADVTARIEETVPKAVAACVADGTLVTRQEVREVAVELVQPAVDSLDKRWSEAMEKMHKAVREMELATASMSGLTTNVTRTLDDVDRLDSRVTAVEQVATVLSISHDELRGDIFGHKDDNVDLSFAEHTRGEFNKIQQKLDAITVNTSHTESRLDAVERFIANRRRIENVAINSVKAVVPTVREHPVRAGVVSALVLGYLLSHNPAVYALVQALFGGAW